MPSYPGLFPLNASSPPWGHTLTCVHSEHTVQHLPHVQALLQALALHATTAPGVSTQQQTSMYQPHPSKLHIKCGHALWHCQGCDLVGSLHRDIQAELIHFLLRAAALADTGGAALLLELSATPSKAAPDRYNMITERTTEADCSTRDAHRYMRWQLQHIVVGLRIVVQRLHVLHCHLHTLTRHDGCTAAHSAAGAGRVPVSQAYSGGCRPHDGSAKQEVPFMYNKAAGLMWLVLSCAGAGARRRVHSGLVHPNLAPAFRPDGASTADQTQAKIL